MDIATLVGIVVGFGCMIFGMSGGGTPASFFHIPSLMIVMGGGVASTLISYRINEVIKISKVAVKAFKGEKVSPFDTIKMLVDMSQKARREGLLALEASQEEIDDDYLKQSLELVVDGVEPEIIRDSMDLELENMKARHANGQGLFKTMASLFPAWGMIGTLIGLINLLKALDDPSSIGPAMAVALITTFYGSVFANFLWTPIANKLEMQSKEEIQLKEMIIEGVLSIQSGENPRIMEHRLKTFLSPQQKEQYNADDSEQDEGAGEEMAG